MRATFIALGLALLEGCSDPLADAQNEVQFVQQAGSLEDICASFRKLEDAAIKAKNSEQLLIAKIKGGEACDNARYGFDPRLSRQIEPDNMQAIP